VIPVPPEKEVMFTQDGLYPKIATGTALQLRPIVFWHFSVDLANSMIIVQVSTKAKERFARD
jgi:hypothetical protein